MRSFAILASCGLFLWSAGHAEEFACPDARTEQLSDAISNAYQSYGRDDKNDEYVAALQPVIAEATRPEDYDELRRACRNVIWTLIDDDVLEERQQDYAGCPADMADKIIKRRLRMDEVYGKDPYLPIVRVGAVWPPKALEQGLSGEVVVEFTVTKKGTVKKVKIVESTNELFNRNALAAAKKLKYKPRKENGKAVETAGVRDRIVFDYEERVRDNKRWECR